MLRIYGTIKSRTARVLWMVEELALAYELVPVDYSTGQTRTASFLAINPNGHVPAIDDGGLRLSESMAINLYLARKHADSPISPRGLAEEGSCLNWSLWTVTEVEASALTVLMHGARLPEERRDLQKLAQATGALRAPLAVLEQTLRGSGNGDGAGRDVRYLLGDRFTVADLNVAAVLAWARAVAAPLSEFPLASAWLDRCLARPSYRRIEAMRRAADAISLPTT